jgi:hypothetical protein
VTEYKCEGDRLANLLDESKILEHRALKAGGHTSKVVDIATCRKGGVPHGRG